MFEIGNKVYFYDEEGYMDTLTVRDEEDNEYYTDLVNNGCIRIFKIV